MTKKTTCLLLFAILLAHPGCGQEKTQCATITKAIDGDTL
jgi:hypothetical protein